MEAARLPAERTPEAPVTREQLQKLAIAEAIVAGRKGPGIARQLAKGDKQVGNMWRKRIKRWAAYDREFKDMLGAATRGEMLLNLGVAVKGLVRQAARGYPPAVKLLFEASGFHNPAIQHEHSGELVVRLEMPRPVATTDEPIPDADVVED